MKKVLVWILTIIVVASIAFGGWMLFNKKSKPEKKETETVIINDEKKEITVEYKTDNYDRSTDNKGLIITNSMTRPKSVSIDNGNKIISYLDEIYDAVWEAQIKETDDTIDGYDPDFSYDAEYGIIYSTTHYINKSIIQFNFVTEGSMGGVEWYESSYYNFDIETGKILELKDICINEAECKKYMKDYFLKVLQRDERFVELDEDYENGVEQAIFVLANYGFTKNGFVMIAQKYDIAPGVAGAFEYAIPYDEFNKFLKEKYRVEVTDLQS